MNAGKQSSSKLIKIVAAMLLLVSLCDLFFSSLPAPPYDHFYFEPFASIYTYTTLPLIFIQIILLIFVFLLKKWARISLVVLAVFSLFLSISFPLSINQEAIRNTILTSYSLMYDEKLYENMKEKVNQLEGWKRELAYKDYMLEDNPENGFINEIYVFTGIYIIFYGFITIFFSRKRIIEQFN